MQCPTWPRGMKAGEDAETGAAVPLCSCNTEGLSWATGSHSGPLTKGRSAPHLLPDLLCRYPDQAESLRGKREQRICGLCPFCCFPAPGPCSEAASPLTGLISPSKPEAYPDRETLRGLLGAASTWQQSRALDSEHEMPAHPTSPQLPASWVYPHTKLKSPIPQCKPKIIWLFQNTIRVRFHQA